MAENKPQSKSTKPIEKSTLARRAMTDAALSAVPYWKPTVPPWEPLKKPNSSLRIAAIISDRLFDGLRFEGDLQLLSPDNWQRTLLHGQPDLLIIESTWETVTGHWYLAQTTPGLQADTLRQLVAEAHSLGIPTVFWFTEDHVYHEHYREFATHFDHVFCADPQETKLLRAEDIQAEDLPPCVQPALYNPFRKHEEYDAMELGVLFDGWGDMDRNPDDYSVLDEVTQEHRLSIIESRYLLTHNRLKAAPSYKDCILGCTTRESRILALKYAKATISFEQTLSTPTTQRWEALQATASYCPAIHFGTFPDGDIRHNLVQSFSDDLEALVELVRIEEDDIYRQRIAHRAWRETLQHHTFSHRVRQICKSADIAHDWDEYPKVSVITPTCRPDMVPQAIKTYRNQSYPNCELILVYNGKQPDELPAETQVSDIKVAYVPGDRFAGAALNLGSQISTGDCCFRMDDDDDYAKHYLLDLMLHRRGNDALLFGKPPSPIRFEGEREVHVSVRGNLRPCSLLKANVFHTGVTWLGGNTIAFKKDLSSNYRSESITASDTFFNLDLPSDIQVLVGDAFNVVANRRDDIKSHTWRISSESIRAGSRVLNDCEHLII